MWLTIVSLARAAPLGASLAAPGVPVAATEAVTFTLSTPTMIVVDGCSPIELEQRDGENWVAIPRVPCPNVVAATEIASNLTLSLPPPAPGLYRAVTALGSGCAPALPFALAGCTGLEIVRSATFTVLAPVAVP